MSISERVRGLMMPGRLAAFRQMARFLMSKGIFGPNPLQDGLNSKDFKTLSPGQGFTPPVTGFRDNLTASFPDPATGTTTNVSGGGAALQTAVTAAGSGTKLVITDSLTYDGNLSISAKSDLIIEADTGQTPIIAAAAGNPNQSCVRLGAGNVNIKFKGLSFLGNGNLNSLSIPDCGLILGTPSVTGFSDADGIIVEDCTFSDLDPANGVPGIQLVGTDGTLHQNVKVIGCTFTDMSTPAFGTGAGYGAVTIGGFGGQVLVQNSKILRSAVARATSNMRGVVLKNVLSTVQDVLCFDIGTGGSNEAFKHNNEAQYGSVVGGGSTWENCVAYNCKRGFRITQTAPGNMVVSHCTFYNDTAGIAAAQTIMQQSAGSQSVKSCVIESAGDGTAFTATVASEDHNDVFNVAAAGKVLDLSDLTVDPVLSDTANNDYRATDAAVVAGGVGGDPMGVFYPGGTTIFWAGVP